MELYTLGLTIKTMGEKEAKAALASIDQSGKQAAQGLSRVESSMSGVNAATKTATAGLGNVQRQMLQTATQAAGLGQASGAVAGSLEALGPIAIGVGVAALGIYEAYKQLNQSSDRAVEKADALSAAFARQRQAAEALTVAGARLALQEVQGTLSRTPKGPGFVAGLAVAGAQALGGFGLAGQAAVEAQVRAALRLKDATDGVKEAENRLAIAIKNVGTSAAKSDSENIRALASLIKNGDAIGNQRQQALLMMKGLTDAMNALPVSDTIGRAGLSGQIKELNDALFPKLHKHVEKLKKELSALATAPHIGITPSKDGTMAAAQNGGVVATESIFGAMKTLPKEMANLPEMINESGKASNEALINWGRTMEDAANTLAQTLGDSIYNAFAAAFSGEGVGGALAAFGKTVLAGLGSVFKMIGMQVIAGSALMVAMKKAMQTWNPVVSLAAGIALVALGGAMGGLAGGAAQRGFASVGGYGGGSNSSDVTRLKFIDRQGNPMDGVTPKAPVYNTFIGVNDPAAQRAIREMYDKGGRR